MSQLTSAKTVCLYLGLPKEVFILGYNNFRSQTQIKKSLKMSNSLHECLTAFILLAEQSLPKCNCR